MIPIRNNILCSSNSKVIKKKNLDITKPHCSKITWFATFLTLHYIKVPL